MRGGGCGVCDGMCRQEGGRSTKTLQFWPPMASPHAREAARTRALQQIQRLFGDKTGKKSSKEQIVEIDEYPGVEALLSPNPPDIVQGTSKRIYRSTSLACLKPAYWPRRPVIFLVEASLFDTIILITILCNCVTMAWESPIDPSGTWKSAFIDLCEWAYLYIFTFELCTKVLAFGFLFHPDSYLRDAWCQLDFIVVTLAWIPIVFPTFGNYSAIRAVRALRPLRALKRVPGMPVLVQSILSALPRVANVLMLCGFIFLVFAIVGLVRMPRAAAPSCASPSCVLQSYASL